MMQTAVRRDRKASSVRAPCAIKVFPAGRITPKASRAWHAVCPDNADLLPVGGATPPGTADPVRSGATGLGTGSTIHRPGCGIAVTPAAPKALVSVGKAIRPEGTQK